MSVKHALLGILARAPKHGYEIKRDFDDKLGDIWSVNFGQIYTTLERLAAEGLVNFEEVAQDDKPDRKVYHITPAGQAEFDDWRTSALKTEPRVLRDELFLRLLFMEKHELDSVLGLINSQKNTYMSQMMQLTNRKFEIEQNTRRALQKSTDEAEQAALEHERMIKSVLLDAAIFHAEADIRWLRHCEAHLNELKGKNGH